MAQACKVLACFSLLLLAGAQGSEDENVRQETIRVEGRLTDEGVACQALRAHDGTLYTLLGDLSGFAPEDKVEVEGTPVEFSFCMQGKTLSVLKIERREKGRKECD